MGTHLTVPVWVRGAGMLVVLVVRAGAGVVEWEGVVSWGGCSGSGWACCEEQAGWVGCEDWDWGLF